MQSTHTVQATITDHATYTPGDGTPIAIPKVPVEIELASESATLSWTADNGATGLTAIPLTHYKEYLLDKKITLSH